MNKNQLLSLARTVLKVGGGIGAGYAIKHGVGDEVTWGQILSGLAAGLGIWASYQAHATSAPTANAAAKPAAPTAG